MYRKMKPLPLLPPWSFSFSFSSSSSFSSFSSSSPLSFLTPSSFLLLFFSSLIILPTCQAVPPNPQVFLLRPQHSFFPLQLQQSRPQQQQQQQPQPVLLLPRRAIILHQLLPISQSDDDHDDPVSSEQPVSDSPPPSTTDLIAQLSRNIPACALGCVIELTNITGECLADNTGTGGGDQVVCLCSDDVSHYTRVLSCVQKKCTMEESIETARDAWEACGKPQRSRKAHLLAPLSIELLALVCVLLRLYSRWCTAGGKFEVDDWVMMIVMGLYIAFEVIGCTAATTAFGVDIWTVDANVLGTSLKFFYMGESFYLVILALTKISILCFYLRIFPQPTFRIVTFAVMTWVSLSGAIFVLCQIFQCVPIPYIWEGWRKGGFGPFTCLDINTLGYTTAAFSIAQDIVILLMPLPLLIKLNVSLRSKIVIMVMFSLGFFVLVTSCVRLWALYHFGDSVNPTWDYTNVLIWTGLEVGVSIIVTSLPAIRVLLLGTGRRRGSRSTSTALAMRRRRMGVLRGSSSNSRTTSTSSFGNTTTVVASWHTMPPHLKRISSVGRISSIKVEDDDEREGGRERSRGDDLERQQQQQQQVRRGTTGLEVMNLDNGDNPKLECMMTGGDGMYGGERGLRRLCSDVSVGNSTVVGSESDFEEGGSGGGVVGDKDGEWPLKNKAFFAGTGTTGGGGGGGQRLSQMPSIDEILRYSAGGQGKGLATHGSKGSQLSNKRSCESEESEGSAVSFVDF